MRSEHFFTYLITTSRDLAIRHQLPEFLVPKFFDRFISAMYEHLVPSHIKWEKRDNFERICNRPPLRHCVYVVGFLHVQMFQGKGVLTGAGDKKLPIKLAINYLAANLKAIFNYLFPHWTSHIRLKWPTNFIG